jgi:nitrogen fixation-related uncharacterized protein
VNSLTSDQVLIVVWTAMTLLLLAGIGAVVAWALRSGQFRGQQRAAQLPLNSPPPENDTARTESPEDKRKETA